MPLRASARPKPSRSPFEPESKSTIRRAEIHCRQIAIFACFAAVFACDCRVNVTNGEASSPRLQLGYSFMAFGRSFETMRATSPDDDAIDDYDSSVRPAPSRPSAAYTRDRRIGTVLGRYRIEAILSQAALGAVYRASHVHTRKSVAMKVLHAELARSSDYALRFEREAITTSRISHPNVVAASDFEKLADGSMYLVLEHVPGETLRSVLASGPLSAERALSLVGQLADALGAVHAAGVIHRSVKPENLLLTLRQGGELLKLTDFGLSTFDLEHDCEVITQVGAAVGTPEYMAPEQVLGQWFDRRADLYALGVVLYEALAGRVPFRAASAVRVLEMHLEEEPPPLPEQIHPALRELVARLLAKQPEARPESAADVLLQLQDTAAAVAQDDLRSRWTLKSWFRRGG